MKEIEIEIKKLLFGNQKQANVCNEAVVSYIAEMFETTCFQTSEDLERDFYDTIKSISENSDRDTNAETFVKFVCGTESYNAMVSGLPCVVSVNQPATDSPKRNFRIYVLGENVEDEPEEDTKKMEISGKPSVCPDEVYNEEDDFATRARKIKDAILPMVPESVKAEIDNEYAQALCCAEYFFDNK